MHSQNITLLEIEKLKTKKAKLNEWKTKYSKEQVKKLDLRKQLNLTETEIKNITAKFSIATDLR